MNVVLHQGNKPDFRAAMGGDNSKQFYETFLTEMKKSHSEDKIKNGVFGAMMDVSIILLFKKVWSYRAKLSLNLFTKENHSNF